MLACVFWLMACHPFEDVGEYPFGHDDVGKGDVSVQLDVPVTRDSTASLDTGGTSSDAVQPEDTVVPPVCECPEIQGVECCGNKCIEVHSDPRNCGGCGLLCPDGALCDNGQCSGGTVCPNDLAMCLGECVDLMNSPRHCGECGVLCISDDGMGFDACQNGQCTFDPACGYPYADCQGTGNCDSNLLSDPGNCGQCGLKCGEGMKCQDSFCFQDSLCVYPKADCGQGACSNLLTDPENCGECGFFCDPNQACKEGFCLGDETCTYPLENCRGTGCDTNTLLDPEHCGGCGFSCGGACANGVCEFTTTCGPGEVFCPLENRCVDTSSNSQNCGDCGTVCPTGRLCESGQCMVDASTCFGPGQEDCNVDGTCEDLTRDPANCGQCGKVCTNGICENSACR